MGSLRIVGMPAERVPEIWPAIRWHFESFAERGYGQTSSDILARVLKEETQCWIVWDEGVRAVALTSVEENRKKAVVIHHCAGTGWEEWHEQLVSAIREWARSIGATRLKTYNRPGWTKALKKLGLRETHRVMEQDIE